MPRIKKNAVIAVIRKLEKERQDLDWKINSNLRTFKQLTEDQTRMKRERAILQDLIRGLET